MGREWKAEWIVDPRFNDIEPLDLFHKEMEAVELPDHAPELQNRHMLVRKVFCVTKPFRKAVLDITADDYYKVYINGQAVGQGPAPGYFFHYNYNRYDVTKYLIQGKNVIAVDVYYQGLINRVWNSGDYRQGLIAELFLDGELEVKTDASWKYRINSACLRAPITSSHNTQFLEHIDARLLPRDWRQLNFDDSSWDYVVENPSDDHDLHLQITPVQQTYMRYPAQVHQPASGHYLMDFGEEFTGTFTTRARGQAGEKLEIRYGEELDETGEHVRYNMRCQCFYQDFWILSGQNDTVEFYDYKSFRYVEITGPEGSLDPRHFAVRVQHYPFDENAAEFDSDHDLLNRIWSICKRAVRNGSQEVYVDCPTREKGQYLGDSLITAHSQLYLTGDVRLLKKAVMDFALSSRICPGLMAVAPGSLMQEIADYSLQWPLLLMLYYRHSGDLEFLREMLPVAENMLDYFKRYQRPDGLLENVTDKWNLVDWPQQSRDGYDFELTKPIGSGCHNVLNALYLGAIQTVNEIKDILRIDYGDELPRLRETFTQAFYRESLGLFADTERSSHASQHANILPLFFDFVEESKKARIVRFLKSKRFSCSVYMAYFLLKALARAEEYDYIFELMTCSDRSSWATMIREDATTCFEAWGKDQKFNTSLCHPWASCPIPVLIEDIIGLKPGQPGWQEISFNPQIPSSLRSLQLKIPTPAGNIRVRVQDGQVTLHPPVSVKGKNRPTDATCRGKFSKIEPAVSQLM